jgi:hypothetical protein
MWLFGAFNLQVSPLRGTITRSRSGRNDRFVAAARAVPLNTAPRESCAQPVACDGVLFSARRQQAPVQEATP